MGKEFETKLAIGDLQLLDCILSSKLVSEKMTEAYRFIKMESTYYDTPQQFLAAKRWTLRLRTENEQPVITLKTPVGENNPEAAMLRGEWEVREAYLEDGLPKLVKIGAPEELCEIKAEDLEAVCSVSFTRITALLRLKDSTTCEICGDIGTLRGGNKTAPLCELEVELKDGSEEAVLAFTEEIKKNFGVSDEPLGKFTRAKALADAE